MGERERESLGCWSEIEFLRGREAFGCQGSRGDVFGAMRERYLREILGASERKPGERRRKRKIRGEGVES